MFEIAPPSTETPLLQAFAGIEMGSSVKNMPVNKMVHIAIQGILKDKPEILPGMSKALKLMSRLAPAFAVNFMDKAIEKAIRQSK